MGKDIELAILFADVVGSTRLYELMGDLRARDMVAICIDVMRSATDQHQGTVIKTMGDEVMSTFPSADEALNAAAQMQQQISSHAQLKVDGQAVAIRVGCHFGPVVLENRDVFGATVHTANRMTSQAKAGQIVTTAATVDKLSPEWRASCRQIDIATIKGQGNEVALYEVLWQTEDVTSMFRGLRPTRVPSAPRACGCGVRTVSWWSMNGIPASPSAAPRTTTSWSRAVSFRACTRASRSTAANSCSLIRAPTAPSCRARTGRNPSCAATACSSR